MVWRAPFSKPNKVTEGITRRSQCNLKHFAFQFHPLACYYWLININLANTHKSKYDEFEDRIWCNLNPTVAQKKIEPPEQQFGLV